MLTTNLALKTMEKLHCCFRPVKNHEQCISAAPELGHELLKNDCQPISYMQY